MRNPHFDYIDLYAALYCAFGDFFLSCRKTEEEKNVFYSVKFTSPALFVNRTIDRYSPCSAKFIIANQQIRPNRVKWNVHKPGIDLCIELRPERLSMQHVAETWEMLMDLNESSSSSIAFVKTFILFSY